MRFFCTKFISQRHPIDIYQLDKNIWLCKGGREKISFFVGGTIYMDSCYFIMKINNKDDFLLKFKEFLVMYSFIFNDAYPIKCYEAGNFSEIKIQDENSIEDIQKFFQRENLTPAVYPIDFNNIGKSGNIFSHFSEHVSLETFYKKFLALEKENKDLLYMFIFNPVIRNSNNEIYKTSFLEIALKFVIIEKILCHKKRLFCESVIKKCAVCEGEDIKHDKISLNQLVKTGLENFVRDDEIRGEYMEYIEMAKKIRNNCFHIGVMDEARYIIDDMLPGETLVYDLEKTKEYSENSSSLFNLKIQISDISRYLLFAELFDVKHFPKLKMMRATRLGGKK